MYFLSKSGNKLFRSFNLSRGSDEESFQDYEIIQWEKKIGSEFLETILQWGETHKVANKEHKKVYSKDFILNVHQNR